ncbi:alpha/beta hydrolase family protein [Dermatobacter hominis]|uniref:alpha/beta hydrolase family protein n=1 Tax=Dermatobacter hominis TaxID=2884263 RepID=UPI001D12046F|nr:alpha/beta fold hydrolase [Dermatobacter hominis]UDY36873.1 CocE/NonD family hydrolase [Dermatobacter hominis]
MGRRRVIGIAVVAAVLAVAGACSSSDDEAGGAPDEATTTTTSEPATCEPEAVEVASAPVPGSTSDVDVTSFDGTTIRAHWFPVEGATGPSPTVLMGPGWGMAGDTDVDAVGVLGAVNIATLRGAGYNVLTWDPRGFGESGGSAQVDSADFEGRDVQQLLSWVAARPEAQLDATGDPAVGMVGGSYGGGIQLVTAAIDCRVDAIVPIIAWHSLGTSLYKDDTYKQGWAQILSAVASRATLDPIITQANQQGLVNGVLTDEQKEWFLDRGPADAVAGIDAPTMVVGGTVDTLFTLDEDVTNYRMLRDADTPVSMYWFCGGHGTCLTEKGDPQRMVDRMVQWLDRYVKRDESVDTGPRFDFLDQDGARYVGDDYPLPAGEPITAEGSGTLELAVGGGSGPATVPAGKEDVLSGVAGDIIPSPAARSVEVPIPVDREAMVLGAPELTLTYRGSVAEGDRPTRLFAQLVDRTSGLVVGNQITPIPVTLDGQEHEVEVPLEVVAHKVTPESDLVLQVVATTTLYGVPRLGGTVDLTTIDVSLPTVTGYRPA